MESMMSPTAAVDADGLVLVGGAAGGTRLRPALAQVLSGILDERLAPQEAVDRPRLHSTGHVVHVEPGFDEPGIDALLEHGYDVAWHAPPLLRGRQRSRQGGRGSGSEA